MSKDDPQQNKVYKLEANDLIAKTRHTMLLPELRRIARDVCDTAGVPMPKLCIRRYRQKGWVLYAVYWHPFGNFGGSIWLDPKRGKDLASLLHELAHHIVAIKNPRARPHGATWVKVYAKLLDAYKLVPLANMRSLCRQYGVKMAS